MAGNRTLTIIKPDAFGSGKAGKIIAHLEGAGFRVVAARVTHLSEAEAGAFYEVHRERPFYRSLVGVHDVRRLHANGARATRRGAQRCVRPSARPTRPKRHPAPSGSCTPSPRSETPFTHPTPTKTRRAKAGSSSPKRNSFGRGERPSRVR